MASLFRHWTYPRDIREVAMNSGLANPVAIKRSRAALKDLEILDLIRGEQGCSIAELADLIEMHPAAVREYVQILALAGKASIVRWPCRRGRTACVVYPDEA